MSVSPPKPMSVSMGKSTRARLGGALAANASFSSSSFSSSREPPAASKDASGAYASPSSHDPPSSPEAPASVSESTTRTGSAFARERERGREYGSYAGR